MKLDPQTLLERAVPMLGPSVEGYWQAISVRPDFAAGEQLNVGLVFRSEKMKTVRLLDCFDKFTRLYGLEAEDEFRFLLRAANGLVESFDEKLSLPAISLSAPKFARGPSSEAIVDRLFLSLVSLAGTAHIPKPSARNQPNNTAVRQHVFDFMRRKAGLDADRIIATDADLLFRDGGKLCALDVPIRFRGRLGTIGSACFASPEAVERALLRCYLDLATAVQLSHATGAALYLCRPPDLGAKRARQIGNVIDVAEWKLRKLQCHFRVLPSAEQIADDVLTWAYH